MAVRIIVGDALEQLRTLPSESVHCCISSPPYFGLRSYLPDGHPDKQLEIGSEPSPDEYVVALVAVFREVRRVLRQDGTVWCNLGDAYANDGKWGGSSGGKHVSVLHGKTGVGRQKVSTGLKPKDLIGIPWLVAFALRADGWWLRRDIIWHKPNPMPESATDRCTTAHEYLFMLTKAERYFYDAEAIAEPALRAGEWNNATEQADEYAMHRVHQVGATRNKRSVWTIATSPYPEAHFATFPPNLVEPCIKAGTSEKGVCAACGAPWVRMVERQSIALRPNSNSIRGNSLSANRAIGQPQRGAVASNVKTTGWQPSCACDAGTVPATVLDPFAGAGTTGLVADRLGRDAVLIELSPAYAEMARRRIADDAGMFAQLDAAE